MSASSDTEAHKIRVRNKRVLALIGLANDNVLMERETMDHPSTGVKYR